jgi:uncharacterized protein YuzE
MEKAKVKASISIDNLQIEHDKDADVLYISFGDPKEANDSIEVQDGIVCRLKDNKLIGITITSFSKRLKS